MVVRAAGWRVLNDESVVPNTSAFLETSMELIRSADAVITVLTDEHGPNAFFETGVALGLGKPVLIVGEDSMIMDDLVPDRVLTSLPRVRAKLTDGDALRFHVTAFLEAVQKGRSGSEPAMKSASARGDIKRSSTEASHRPSNLLENRLLAVFEDAPEVEAVHVEVQIVTGRTFRPDFALWLRDVRHSLQNPLIVDVISKEGVRRGTKKRRVEKLLGLALDTGVGTIMLVEETEGQPLELLRLSPLIYSVGLTELEGLLDRGELVATMLRARNMLAHSAD
jgi:hypothetical protein